MNEKIKELARESNLDVYGLGKDRYKWESTVEKFAELIVRECVEVAQEYGFSLIGKDENYLGETLFLSINVQEAGNKIAEHFGIELKDKDEE